MSTNYDVAYECACCGKKSTYYLCRACAKEQAEAHVSAAEGRVEESSGIQLIASAVMLGARLPETNIAERLSRAQYERVRNLVLAGAHCAREIDRVFQESNGHKMDTNEKGVTG